MVKSIASNLPYSLERFEFSCLNLPQKITKKQLQSSKDFFFNLKDDAKIDGKMPEFIDRVVSLADHLWDNGNKMQKILSKIIYGEAIKILEKTDNTNPRLLNLIEKNLQQHKQQKNSVHVLSRLHLLSDAYAGSNDKLNKFKVLKEKLTLVNEILDDYKQAKMNFCSINRPVRSEIEFLKEKAAICNELALTMAHEKRNKAIFYIKESISVYKKLNMKKEIIFAEKQLKRIKTSNMQNKLKKYSGFELHQKTFSDANQNGVNSLSRKKIVPNLKKWDYDKIKPNTINTNA